MLPWALKYRPKKLSEVAGNPSAVKALYTWFKSWKPGKKALLLVGPPGVGKTASAYALAEQEGLDILEMNASDVRNKARVERVLGIASQYGSLFSSGRLILVDELDGMLSQDRGGSSAIKEIIKTSRQPIILIANDAYARPVKAVAQYVETVNFKRINPHTIMSVLAMILKKEGIRASNDILERLAKNSNGDLKSAINDLQAIAQGQETVSGDFSFVGNRDREENVFNALKVIFKTKRIEEARNATNGLDVDPDMLLAWLEENVPNEYEDPGEVRDAFSWLAKADIFRARIMKRQSWGLLSFFIELITGGVALAKKSVYKKFVKYAFPTKITYLSRTKSLRATRYSIASKVGEVIHASPREVIQVYLPYMAMGIRNRKDARKLGEIFELDEDEVDYLISLSRK